MSLFALRACALAILSSSLLATQGCAEPVAPKIVPGTNVAVSELFLLPGSDRPLMVSASPRPTFCLQQEVRGNFRGAGLYRLTGAIPFSAPKDIVSGSCNVRLATDPSKLSVKGATKVANEDCTIWYRVNGEQISSIDALTPASDPDRAMRCGYRVGLFALGFNGAARLKTALLFRPTEKTIFAPERSLMGDWVPYAVLQLLITCDVKAKTLTRQNASQVNCKGGAQ